MRLVKKVAIISVIATGLRSLKRFFRAFYFLSAYLVFNINGLQISLTFQLIKPAIQASCSSYFSHSFTKLASLIFSCLIIKPKSTYFSLINSIIGRSRSRSLRTYSMFLDRRWFYISILNISQSSRLTSFRIKAWAVRSSLILTRLIGNLQQAVYRPYYNNVIRFISFLRSIYIVQVLT